MNLSAANGLGTQKIIIKNFRLRLHLLSLSKIESVLKLSISFSTTVYRAAMRTTNFVAGVSHFACNVKNGKSIFLQETTFVRINSELTFTIRYNTLLTYRY